MDNLTLLPANRKVDRGNLVLKHYVPDSVPLDFWDNGCSKTHGPSCYKTKEMEFVPLSINQTHNRRRCAAEPRRLPIYEYRF